MIRKKWIAGEPVLSVETEDEFWKALATGETVELTGELGEKIGLMEEDVPESTPENPLLTMDGRPTVRLSSE